MAITNTWAVVRLNCYPEVDGKTNVVCTVHWALTATDGTYSASTYGAAGVTVNPDGPFTAYADLTEAEVVGWVQSELGEDVVVGLEANLATEIQNQVNPPVTTPALPWNEGGEDELLERL